MKIPSELKGMVIGAVLAIIITLLVIGINTAYEDNIAKEKQNGYLEGYIEGFYYGANYGFGEAMGVYNQSIKSEATYAIVLGYESIELDGNHSEFNLTDNKYLLTEITPEADRLDVKER